MNQFFQSLKGSKGLNMKDLTTDQFVGSYQKFQKLGCLYNETAEVVVNLVSAL